MSKLARVLSIIWASLLVAFSVTLAVVTVIMSAPVAEICFAIMDVIVSVAILCVVIRLCKLFRTQKVKTYDEWEYYEPEPEPEPVTYSEAVILGDGYVMLVKQVQK